MTSSNILSFYVYNLMSLHFQRLFARPCATDLPPCAQGTAALYCRGQVVLKVAHKVRRTRCAQGDKRYPQGCTQGRARPCAQHGARARYLMQPCAGGAGRTGHAQGVHRVCNDNSAGNTQKHKRPYVGEPVNLFVANSIFFSGCFGLMCGLTSLKMDA